MEPGRRAEIVVDGGKADAAQNAARAESIRGTAADDTQHTGDFDPFDAEGDDYDETATDESWNRGRGGPDRSGLLPAPPVPGAGIPPPLRHEGAPPPHPSPVHLDGARRTASPGVQRRRRWCCCCTEATRPDNVTKAPITMRSCSASRIEKPIMVPPTTISATKSRS